MRANRPQLKFSSGYKNVDIIGNEDLFPTEGYEFLPRDPTQSTMDRYISVDFPFNREVSRRVVKHEVQVPAPEKPIDKPLPKVNKYRSKLIYETTLNMRGKQKDYNTRYNEYQNEVRETEKLNEQEEIKAFKEVWAEDQKKHLGEKAALRQNYEEQFRLRDLNRKKQEQEEQKEADYYKKLFLEQEEAARKAAEEKRQLGQKLKEEFNERNRQLEEFKKQRHQREKEEELRIRNEAASLSMIQEQRRKMEEEARLEQTRRREKVVEIQSKALAEQKAKIEHFENAGESAAAANQERQRKEAEDRMKAQQAERKLAYARMIKEREIQSRRHGKKSFPSRFKEFDEDKFNEEQRAHERKMYQTMQLRQIAERREREKKEMEDDLRMDQEMLEASQKKFDQSLARLQSVIPPEMNITVPKYTVSTRLMSSNLGF